MVFAGVSGTKDSGPSLGLITGAYKEDANGRLIWNKKAEWKLPAGGEDSWIVGFQNSCYRRWISRDKPEDLKVKVRDDGKRPVICFAIESRYLVRRVTDGRPVYDVKTIHDPSRCRLGAVRTVAASPFPEDRGRVLYMGGVDCNGIAHHDTGWIFRVALGE